MSQATFIFDITLLPKVLSYCSDLLFELKPNGKSYEITITLPKTSPKHIQVLQEISQLIIGSAENSTSSHHEIVEYKPKIVEVARIDPSMTLQEVRKLIIANKLDVTDYVLFKSGRLIKYDVNIVETVGEEFALYINRNQILDRPIPLDLLSTRIEENRLYVNVLIAGEVIPFLIDTGASMTATNKPGEFVKEGVFSTINNDEQKVDIHQQTIIVDKVRLKSFVLYKPTFRNVLGLDLLKVFKHKFKDGVWKFNY